MPREIDSATVTSRFSIAVWSVAAGSILGGAAGAKAAGVVGVFVGIPLAVAAIYTLASVVVSVAGRAATSIASPSGNSTPPKRDYSLAQSFVARERYEEAISAYEVACADHPDDPEPYLRLARLYRDHLRDYHEAILWFKRGRTEATLTGRQEQLVTLELVELYRDRLGTPNKAIPELARLAERFAGSSIGESAKRELEQLRSQVLAQQKSNEPIASRHDEDTDAEDGYVSLQPD